MADVVVIFDFDKTMVLDCECDDWVVDELGVTQLLDQLRPTMPWNSLMDRMMGEIHSQGKSIEEIADALKRLPIHPRIISAVKSAHALGCNLRIVSDANMFFIETILKHNGLRDCFSEINTNPGLVDENGRLRILPFHDFTKSPHACTGLCPPNMCKGIIIERIQTSLSKECNTKIIYIGDGVGDFCSALKLGDGDYVMPRKNFPVWNLINANSTLIKAKIHEWADGEELEHVLIQLIEENRSSNGAQLFPTDCKLEIISSTSLETMPQSRLSVRNY